MGKLSSLWSSTLSLLSRGLDHGFYDRWGPPSQPKFGGSWRAQGSDGGRDHTRPEPNSYRRTSWNKWCTQDFQMKAGDTQDIARG